MSGLSDKGKVVLTIIEGGDFGCKTGYVAKIMGTVMGEDLFAVYEAGNKDGTFDFHDHQLAVVVPTTCENAHNYPLDKPCLVIQGYNAYRPGTDDMGNSLDDDSYDYYRPATPEEVEATVRAWCGVK